MRTYYIYKATNKVNGKSYIGQTCDLKTRIWQHWRCYEKEDCLFHRAIQKYGKENFEWEVLETCTEKEKATLLEKRYIAMYNTFHSGYNENKGGVGGHNARAVVCLEKDGKFVKRYDSASDAEKDGFCNSDVLISCKDKKRLCKKHQFMFEDDYIKYGGRIYEKPKPSSMRSIIQCDMDGNFIAKYESVKKAAEETGANRTTISGVLTKTYKSANGFIFVHEEDFPIKDLSIYQKKKKGRKVAQVDANTGKIIKVFDRISEAGKELGVCYKAIQRVVDENERTAYGYKWISQ